MATADGLAHSHPAWTQPAQLFQAKEETTWPLNDGVSLFPLDGQKLNAAQMQQLHQHMLSSLQSTERKQNHLEQSSSDPSRQGSEEVLTLKEKNRRAQQKFRAKQKVRAYCFTFLHLLACSRMQFIVLLQAKLSEAESKVSDLADQLQDLKSQLAAAESRQEACAAVALATTL